MVKEAAFSVSAGRKGMTDEEIEEMKRGNGETGKRGNGETGKRGNGETGKRRNEETTEK
jgi:hypothetical protein